MRSWQGLRATTIAVGMLCLCQFSFANDGLLFDAREKSKLTTKGDLETRNSTVRTRLQVGNNGEILSADSSTATGLRWVTAPSGGGTPGGATTQVQYNSSGTFAGDPSFIWAVLPNTLSISSDAAQDGDLLALVISNDVGGRVANISHDGAAFFNRMRLSNDLAVVDGGTGLSSGTSGGILGFTAAGTISSSNLLTASAVIVGGGSGSLPTAITADTATVGHFLGSTAGSPAFRQVVSADVNGVFDVDTQTNLTATSPLSLATTGVLSASITTADVTGTVGVNRGGTGLTSYTKGDLLAGDASGNLLKLPVGVTAGMVLSVDATTSSGMKWGFGGGNSAGGSNTQIQYNSSSSFAGDPSLIWSSSPNTLSISADLAQDGNLLALVISSDEGVRVANISHDGSAFFNRLRISNDLAVVEGGTGLSSGTSGGVLGFTASGTIASSNLLTASAVIVGGGSGALPTAITADTATSGHFLASTAASPAFRQIVTADLSGTLSVTNGGTSATTLTDGGVLIGNGSAAIVNTGVIAKGGLIVGDGATDPVILTVGTNGFVLSADSSTASGTKWAEPSPLTTKGDIYTYGATTTRLAVGANGTVLSADSSTVTGLKWVTPAAGAGGTPGGSNTQLQYNSSSSFAGTTLLTWDSASSRLSLGPGAGLVSLDVGGNFRTVPITLTDGATVNLDASRSNFYILILGGNRTLANATNGVIGQKIILLVSQDATGGRKLGFGTNYKFGSDVPSYDSSTTAGSKDYIAMIFSGVSMDIVGVSRGYR